MGKRRRTARTCGIRDRRAQGVVLKIAVHDLGVLITGITFKMLLYCSMTRTEGTAGLSDGPYDELSQQDFPLTARLELK